MVRYLNPSNNHQARITKPDKEFAKKLDLKNIKLRVRNRDIHKTEKTNSINVSDFGYENKEKHPIYVSKKKNFEEKHVHFIIDRRKRKKTLCSYQRF